MNPSFRNFAIWVAVAALLLVLFQVFQSQNQGAGPANIPSSDGISSSIGFASISTCFW